jgi:hypothetical protein
VKCRILQDSSTAAAAAAAVAPVVAAAEPDTPPGKTFWALQTDGRPMTIPESPEEEQALDGVLSDANADVPAATGRRLARHRWAPADDSQHSLGINDITIPLAISPAVPPTGMPVAPPLRSVGGESEDGGGVAGLLSATLMARQSEASRQVAAAAAALSQPGTPSKLSTA